MQESFEYLSDDDLDWLDVFLLSRFDDEAEDDLDANEGVLCVSELDGFFTAVVSGPVMIPPSVWLLEVWGDFEPEWDNDTEDDMQRALSLMMQFMNEISATLMMQPENFEALFLESQFEGKTNTIVDEWCQGYMRGVNLAADQWKLGGPEIDVLLAPIMAFVGEEAMGMPDKFNHSEIKNLQNIITPNVCEIHAYWLARREDDELLHTPVQRTEPRVGRNDPCPCGSGKKYKKCCLH